MTSTVIFAGFGGQGVLTAGLVLAQIGVDAGYEVLWSPAYGGEMRGGKAYSMVKLADRPILDPISGTLDVLVAMNGPALDFRAQLAPGGLLIADDGIAPELLPPHTLRAPLQAIAHRADNPRGASLAAAGCAAAALGLFRPEAAADSVRQYFTKKGKAAYSEANAAALLGGWEFYEKEAPIWT